MLHINRQLLSPRDWGNKIMMSCTWIRSYGTSQKVSAADGKPLSKIKLNCRREVIRKFDWPTWMTEITSVILWVLYAV